MVTKKNNFGNKKEMVTKKKIFGNKKKFIPKTSLLLKKAFEKCKNSYEIQKHL
jgi:hypothetical protein